MSTRLRTKLVKNLTPEEYKKLRHLTKPRMKGGMRDWLNFLYDHPTIRTWGASSPRVWWYERDDGQVQAWSLMHFVAQLHDVKKAKREGWTEDDLGWWGNVYVRASERRKGYGSRLLAEMTAKHPDLHVSPYEWGARGFYVANGFTRLLTAYSLVRP